MHAETICENPRLLKRLPAPLSFASSDSKDPNITQPSAINLIDFFVREELHIASLIVPIEVWRQMQRHEQ